MDQLMDQLREILVEERRSLLEKIKDINSRIFGIEFAITQIDQLTPSKKHDARKPRTDK
jgi:hypothetical protein